MTQEQQDTLRRALYNAKFTTDAHDEDPFVGVYFNDLLDIIKDYVEQPLIDKACKWIEKRGYSEDITKGIIDNFRKAMQ